MVWPVSIMVDVVFSPTPKADPLYRGFLSMLPKSVPGQVVGLAVMGMPIGSPGMEGANPQRYDVVSFDRLGRVAV